MSKYARVPLHGLEPRQRDGHFNRHGDAGRHHEHAGLGSKVSGEAFGVRNHVPRLYANEIGPRLGPDTEIGRTRVAEAYPGCALGTVAERGALDFVENDDVVLKKRVGQREASIEHRRWMTLGCQQSIAVETSDRGVLVVVELDEVA